MKVVILADSIATQQTGIHRYGTQLVKHLAKQRERLKLTLVTPRYLPDFMVPQLVVPIQSFIPLHLRLRQLFLLGKKVMRLSPDVVIELAHFGPFGLPASVAKVTVVHDVTPITFPQYHDLPSVLFHRYLFPRVLGKSDMIIANSMTTKRDLMEILSVEESKIDVYYPSLPDLGGTPNAGNSPRQRPYFLTVGTIEPRKNHQSIIRAFEIFSKSFPDFDLVIVGKKGWKTRRFQDSIAKSPVRNKIIQTDFISTQQLQDLYRSAVAFVFASHYEGLGLPVLEAMQTGVPLILSSIGSSKELVKEEQARWFAPGNPEELAQHFTQMVTDPSLKTVLTEHSKRAYKGYELKVANQDLAERLLRIKSL
jgi:glycosyltransferase involved in cell wall biosynthesis